MSPQVTIRLLLPQALLGVLICCLLTRCLLINMKHVCVSARSSSMQIYIMCLMWEPAKIDAQHICRAFCPLIASAAALVAAAAKQKCDCLRSNLSHHSSTPMLLLLLLQNAAAMCTPYLEYDDYSNAKTALDSAQQVR